MIAINSPTLLNGMSTVVMLQPNEWLTKDLLMLVTGLTEGKIRKYRGYKGGWVQGKEWILVATDGTPKPNSEAMYNLPAINKWLSAQSKKQPTKE